MLTEINLRVPPRVSATDSLLHKSIAENLKLDISELNDWRILSRSIDARQRKVFVNLRLEVATGEDVLSCRYNPKEFKPIGNEADKIIIVGAGPAGLFAALKAIELGVKPILFERGKDVDSRRLDLAKISRQDKIDSESNYCFGEGGAGTYSDGKLFTRSRKRGSVGDILSILHQMGADESVLYDAHPHIGSEKLPGIIKNIRETIIRAGGEVHFSAKVEELIIDANEVKGVLTVGGERHYGPVVLATGHSARDMYETLHRQGVKLEPKGLAIGVRLEHPQTVIDRIQYHNPEGRGEWLPAAEYSFVTQVDGRGVYSFCMCPGGVIVPAATSDGQSVVNGMSASARSSRWANSGMVVEIRPGDFPEYAEAGVFEMMKLQQNLEKNFYDASGHSLNAPAQRMKDFVNGKISCDLPASSFAPGIHSAPVHFLLPEFISNRLREGFKVFGSKAKGFLTNEAIVVGLESRTSSPIRIPRDKENMCHIEIKGLYPAGEGAGQAGGIVSSAIDGQRAAEACCLKLLNNR